jgi:hypothetical protein
MQVTNQFWKLFGDDSKGEESRLCAIRVKKVDQGLGIPDDPGLILQAVVKKTVGVISVVPFFEVNR